MNVLQVLLMFSILSYQLLQLPMSLSFLSFSTKFTSESTILSALYVVFVSVSESKRKTVNISIVCVLMLKN